MDLQRVQQSVELIENLETTKILNHCMKIYLGSESRSTDYLDFYSYSLIDAQELVNELNEAIEPILKKYAKKVKEDLKKYISDNL